ncbi:hypothetical protein D1BOALGB6SA_6917 [Olavius sp. associated proteobacterium Delta 1]|nr:hypothetical protein D1BOALGB6SA_6917 [Olavius sp. associated proteobacterium Delta 1]
MNQKYINIHVDRCIEEEDLPVRASLKVIRKNDPDYGLTADEINDRNEFIRCYMLSELGPLLLIPEENDKEDFIIEDYYESAFNTNDFYRLHKPKPYNGYHYRLKQIFEKVKDLAIMHSCISHQEGKHNTRQRYKSLVDNEFRDEAAILLDTLKKYPQWVDRKKLAIRLAKLNSNIKKCSEIWKAYAFWE